MLILISPAKTFDFNSLTKFNEETKPFFESDANKLVKNLIPLGEEGLKKIMNISENLANINMQRYLNFTKLKKNETKQAIFAFHGDVYESLNVKSFKAKDLKFSQIHLRILSGLYGYLRPFDLIKPYRLEMGTSLTTKYGSNLYDWWGDRIANQIEKDLRNHNDKFVINLASKEYFKVVEKHINVKVITPIFQEKKGKNFKTIGIYAKKARGSMTSYILKNKIKDIENIKCYSELGYKFNNQCSDDKNFIFQRA